jgi:hypothetical protein
MANLASTYGSQGRWTEAEELEMQVMETRKRLLGPEHPSTLTSIGNLALTWRCLGRRKDAMKLIEISFQLMKTKLGPDHPYTKSSLEILTEWREADSEIDDQTFQFSNCSRRFALYLLDTISLRTHMLS